MHTTFERFGYTEESGWETQGRDVTTAAQMKNQSSSGLIPKNRTVLLRRRLMFNTQNILLCFRCSCWFISASPTCLCDTPVCWNLLCCSFSSNTSRSGTGEQNKD